MAPRFGIGEHIERLSPGSRLSLGTFLLVAGCVADFVSGPQYRVLLLYLAAVTYAAWYVGVRFAVLASIACTGSRLVVEWGGPGPHTAVYWNSVMRLLSFLLVVWLTREKRTDFVRIRDRGARDAVSLRAERTFSGSLQREVEVREAEQRRIGRDLHDGLSQYLTAAMLASQVLEERLTARSTEESLLARRIGGLVRDAMGLVQALTRGLYPADLMAAGLPAMLERLAATTHGLSRAPCDFTTTDEDMRLDETQATHLFRIAQEALSNAVRHAGATQLSIGLAQVGDRVELTVTDDGVGISGDAANSGGLGMRTMRERARSMGASLDVGPLPRGGTRVRCVVTVARGAAVAEDGVAAEIPTVEVDLRSPATGSAAS